jgi:uncharacterized membrane protein
VRRPTLIVIVALFVVLVGAAAAQLVIASGDRPAYQGPTSPGQLPSPSATPAP